MLDRMAPLSRRLALQLFGASVALALQSAAAQTVPSGKLCDGAMKPALTKMTLHWDWHNRFGDRKGSYKEFGFTQVGEGEACRIQAQADPGGQRMRNCSFYSRLSCTVEFNGPPLTHTFRSGSSEQTGKLAWEKNEPITVNVKQGATVTPTRRDAAVITFSGTWYNGPNQGRSVATILYDREWGNVLKASGSHDANDWSDTLTLIEVAP